MRPRLALGLVLLFSASLLAQTGNLDPTPLEAAKLPTFVPQAIELIEEKVVDLRPWMPPVGEQRMNDCTTWAMGYGLKSYFEAREQGWRPDAPSRIFSPRFLYNQINNGEDKGCNYIQAIKIMQQQGIATLATEPYQPGDFKGQPKPSAKEEASVFPVLDGLRITSRVGIRRALQRRQAVAFGAIVCPIFLSGQFEIYGPGDFTRGLKLKQANQPHGRHAMVIVGYDDGRGAFLVQNSWGTRWNQKGYCWVKYELFDTIRPAKDEEGIFCLWAATLLDVEEPIERDASGKPRTKPLDLKTLSAKGFADITRYDEKVGKYRYVFNADLRGQREAIAKVDVVTWTWEDETGQKRTSVTRDAEMQFPVMGGSYTNPIKLRGTAKLKDGKEQWLGETEIVGPTPKAEFRQATPVFTDQYEGRVQGGKPWWQWHVGLDVPLNEVENIAKVVWNVGEWNRQEPVQTLTGFNGPPATERAGGFALESQKEITGTITYRDGGVKTVKITPKITDPVRDEPTIEVETRELNTDSLGNTHYAWTLTVDRPREQDTKIKHVEWEIDPWLPEPKRTEIRVRTDYATAGISHRDFRATATVVYEDGRPPVKIEKWVELGPKSRFAGNDRFEINAYDKYTGLIGGRRYWSTTWQLIGDREQIRQVKDVKHLAANRETVAQNLEDNYAFRMGIEGKFKVSYTFTGPDGKPRRLDTEYTPRAPANDAMRPMVVMSDEPDYFMGGQKYAHSYAVYMEGPADLANTIQQVDYRHRVRGRMERTIVQPGMVHWPWQLRLQSAADEPFELEAVVTHMDGFRERLSVPVKPGISVDQAPEMTLRVRETFHSYDEETGAPKFSGQFQVVGDAKFTDQIAKVDYEINGYRLDKVYNLAADKNVMKAIRFHGPTRIAATVTMNDGSTRQLSGELFADMQRTQNPLAVRVVRDFREGSDRVPKGERAFIAFLAGWEGTLSQVDYVNYFAKDDRFNFGVKERRVWTSEFSNFPIYHSAASPCPVRVEVVMKDGTGVEVNTDAVPPLKPLGWDHVSRYWGDGLWETDLFLTGEPDTMWPMGRYPNFVTEPRVDITPIPVWPTQRARVRWAGGKHVVKEFQYGNLKDRDRRLPGREITVDKGPAREALELIVARHPHQPGEARLKEWIMVVAGPEKDLSRLKSVTYKNGETTYDARQRWGEVLDGFERHVVFEDQPTASAVVTFEDGATKVLP